jgi:hypothetical protein
MAFNLLPSKWEISNMSSKDLHYANYTDENVLFKTHPKAKFWEDVTGNVLEYVATHTDNIYAGGSMIDSFTKSNNVRIVDSEWIRWSLKGTGKVKCYLIENLQPNNPTTGIGHSEILLKYSHELWRGSDTIYPEIAPSVEFTIQEDPVSDSTGFIYKLVLKTTDEFEFVDPDLLEEGLIWCKRGATHSEASYQYGSSMVPGGPSIITFQTTLGSFSKAHEVTDKGYHQMLRVRAKDANDQFMPQYKDQVVMFSEAEFMNACKYERDSTLFWGRDAGQNIIDPTTGYHRRSCPGAVEFYEDGNMVDYNDENFTVGFLKDLFTEFFYGKVRPSNANIVVKAGLGLMELVDKALTREYARKPVERPHNLYAKAGSTIEGSNQAGLHLTAPQFLGFDMYPYGTIKFEHMQILDDLEMNGGLMHPTSNKPLTSYWGFVDNIGIGSGNNAEYMKLRNAEQMFYVCGAYSPAGPIDGTSTRGFIASHSGRSYKLYHNAVEGIRFKDTKRTLFLHPAIE